MVMPEDVYSWADRNFGSVELGHVKRRKRIMQVAAQMALRPGASLFRLFEREYDMKAMYSVAGHNEVTPDKLQLTHHREVRKQMSNAGVYLLPEDTTTVSYSGRKPIRELGPVGKGDDGLQGFFMHSVMAVRWNSEAGGRDGRRPPLEILGLADQQIFVRTARENDEGRDQKKKRLRRARESQRWEFTSERLQRSPDGAVWIRVMDREGDCYPVMESCSDYGHSFLIRACQNRKLVSEADAHAYLFEAIRDKPAAGSFDLKLRATGKRAARTAHLSVSWMEVTLKAPWRPDGVGEPLTCRVVHVWEENPPKGLKEPVEWILVTDRPCENFQQAYELVMMYSSRWVVEEFHKVVKDGVGLERLQLESGHGLMNMGALMSVVALRVLMLKENGRTIPDNPANEAGLDQLELHVLQILHPKPIHTVKDVLSAVGRLGGHKGRKCDGMPGWKTIWYGIQHLHQVMIGYRLAKQTKKTRQ